MPNLIAVVEVGGTHVAGALVDMEASQVLGSRQLRVGISAEADSYRILDSIAEVANHLIYEDVAHLVLAMPGPADYRTGVTKYEPEGKLGALANTNMAAALRVRLRTPLVAMSFLNDADAFLLGEWANGSASGHRRAAAVILGTGVGSSYLINGYITDEGPGIPKDGSIHNVTVEGVALEEVISRDAIIRDYLQISGRSEGTIDVEDIARMARSGNHQARGVLERALNSLGHVLSLSLRDFEPSVLVVGGRIARSWDIVGPELSRCFASEHSWGSLLVAPALHLDESVFLGAAIHACRHELNDVRNPGFPSW